MHQLSRSQSRNRRRAPPWWAALTLPAKKLYEIVKSLPDTDIRIAEDRSGVKVAADRFDSRLQTLPKDDFPALPPGGGQSTATLTGAAFKEMVVRTQFAITGEDTRYFLNGALFVLRPDSMSLVATDGHRLALVTAKREGAAGDADEVKAILPKKTLGELVRLLGIAHPSLTPIVAIGRAYHRIPSSRAACLGRR